MGQFNLNNPIDFARATNSFGSSIVNTFNARGASNWLIEEGKFKSGITPTNEVIFHVFISPLDYGGALSQISDEGGRRLAKYEFPLLDGQLISDMGREGETFNLSIVLHGNNYLAAFNSLLQILNEPVPGILTHPVRGEITCQMERYRIIHQESQRKAVAIELTMSEHSIEAIQLANVPDKTAPSLLSKLTASFAKIENAINSVQGAIFMAQSLKNQIIAGLQLYENLFSKVSGNMNATFNPGGNIPALLPTQGAGLQSSSGTIISNATTIAVSPSDPFASAPLNLLSTALQQALAIDHIQKDIQVTRQQLSISITAMEAAGNGQGSLAFHDEVVALRETANDLQVAFEAGKQSSQFQIVDFITPRIMSVREIAFANGISPNDGDQIIFLNPDLDSLNYVPQGTVVKVGIP